MIYDDITQSYRDRKTNIRIFFHQIYPNITRVLFLWQYVAIIYPILSEIIQAISVAVVFLYKMGWGNRPWKKMGSSLRLSFYKKVVPRFNRSFYNWTMSFYRHFFVFMECHFNHISPHTQIVFIKWKFFNRCILYKHGCPPHLIDTMIWPANVPPFMLYLWGCPLHFIEILLLWNGQGSPPWADSRGMR